MNFFFGKARFWSSNLFVRKQAGAANPKLLKLQPKWQQGQPCKGYKLPVRSRKTKPDAVEEKPLGLSTKRPEKEKARSELYRVGSE